MIAYFPTAYPDELLYSQLSRYYTKSGYMAYTFAAEDLFMKKNVRPDIEFVNVYTPSAIKVITRAITMKKVVMQHTMFPLYGRFLPKERRDRAFRSLVDMAGGYHNLLPIPQTQNGKVQCLRYCPMCAECDRGIYGETYWHRIHQMIGIHICPIHKCHLMNSSVTISGKSTPCLRTAEEMIPLTETVIFVDNEIETHVAEYMAKVFQADVDMDSCSTASEFLYSRMANTKYRSVRGEQRNITLFHADFIEFYKDLPHNWFTELWQIQKLLTGERINTYETCLMELFLNIPANELVHMELPEKTQQECFDEEVYRLHEQGLKYPEIAKTLNAPYATVKAIGERRYGTYHKPPKAPLKSGVKPQNWQQIDEDTLPLVRKAIKQLQGDGCTRPRKVSVGAIEKMLGLSNKKISLYLPKCLEEIQKFEESQEQYWAREVVWAARMVLSSGDTLVWKKVRDMTNMKRRNLEACLPYITDNADRELAEQIRHLIE